MKAQADIIYDKYKVERAYEYTNNSLLTSAMKVFPDAPKTLLREHYRCHPDIIGFCNKKFYNNELIIMSQKNSQGSPLHVIKTVKGNHARGRINKRQIDVVMGEVVPEYLFSEDIDVGVIAPYRKQVTAIKEKLKSAGVEGVQVDTVHKYQGREKDTIILSTVDNTATEFADQDHMMNVAVSRARNKLVVVASSEADKGQSNLAQLIRYAEYKNGTITESNIRSIFDYLYADYDEARNRLLTDADKISEYDSENLIYKLIKDEICSKRSEYGIAAHVPMRMIVKDTSLLSDKKQIKYASHPWTHFDFTIYNKITKEIVLVIEVDGTAYHKENSKQSVRDGMKDEIAKIYSIPLIRIRTDESGVLEKIEQALVDRQVS